MACTLRLICINDVYDIGRLPHYATARREEGSAAGVTLALGVLPGDFVAPSLLSSLDKGAGMIDCLSQAGMDFVCIGNHENDIPMPQLQKRIQESKFTWINSNMPDLPLGEGMAPLPRYCVVEVGANTPHPRRVALLGLNTEDRSILRADAFGGATIEPLLPTAQDLYDEIMSKEAGIDAIIPLTHQLMPLDRALAERHIGFPAIIGGHDHDVYIETIAGCQIVKTGINGEHIAVCDLTWRDTAATAPEVTVRLHEASFYAPDPAVALTVARHKRVLVELEKSVLCVIPPSFTLSSVGIRLDPVTMGTFMCSVVRDELDTDCCLISAGNIRGNRDYSGSKVFTYADLKSEVPFVSSIVVVDLPGAVIASAIQFSRQPALSDPPVEKGGYLQCDDGIAWERVTNTTLTVAGEPLDAEKMYSVAIAQQLLDGLDNIAPLVEYKGTRSDLNIHADAGMGLKEIIVAHFARELWTDMIQSLSFAEMDADGSGFVSREELLEAARCKYREVNGDAAADISTLLVDNLFRVADANSDGLLSKSELVSLALNSLQKLKIQKAGSLKRKHSDETYMLSVDEAKAALRDLLGSSLDDEPDRGDAMLQDIIDAVDADRNGSISQRELEEHLKRIAKHNITKVKI